MKPFMDKDFLLTTDAARELFHDAAEHMPILDFHCHLNPNEIAENTRFRNIGHLMLGGDHYKWRAMLSYGVEERLIRGDADDKEKFLAYARMLPNAIGNPLYHWTHLELQRVFDIYEPLNEQTAESVWERTSEMLTREEFRARGLIDRFHVDALCTTDDPADDLAAHKRIAEASDLNARVLPAFRPDKAINIDRPGFAEYIARLSASAGVQIRCLDDLLSALDARVDYFHALGARISDHALDEVPVGEIDMRKAEKALRAALSGEEIKDKHAASYKLVVLCALGEMYNKRGWAQQYHIGAMRNNNSRMFAAYGPDVGFDSIIDSPVARGLSRLLDEQDRRGALPKTVLYNLDPSVNAVIGSMIGNFQQSGTRGKMQMGAAWWFLDQRDGMTEQIKWLANLGLLSQFVGMLTDSRSFISYPRHEYFRRILCETLGNWVEYGEYPADMPFLKGMVRDICFGNAKAYFGI